mgnify:CR=1 FL=1
MRREHILSKNTMKLIEKRERRKTTMSNSNRDKIEYAALNKTMKKEIIESSKSIKKTRTVLNEGKHWMTGVKDNGGSRITSRRSIISTATDYYKILYSNSTLLTEENMMKLKEIEVPKIIKSEVKQAIRE